MVNCSLKCDEVVNCSAHGRCPWDGGSCICFAGWTGSSCDIPLKFASPETTSAAFNYTLSMETTTRPSDNQQTTFNAIIPGLEVLGTVQVLLPTVTLGVPSPTSETTYRLPGQYSQIRITFPAGSWVSSRRAARPLTATVFAVPSAANSTADPSLPGTSCGAAVDLGPHDLALAAPFLISLPCDAAVGATAAAYGLTAGRWVALPLPSAGGAYANGSVWAQPSSLRAMAAFASRPAPAPAASAGPAAGIVIGSTVGAAACCLASAAAGWALIGRRSRKVRDEGFVAFHEGGSEPPPPPPPPPPPGAGPEPPLQASAGLDAAGAPGPSPG